MTSCRVLRSTLIYFGRNMNISSIFYFSKSTSINTQHSSLWDTLEMMLFTKYLIKWKRIGRISWKFQYWFDLNSSIKYKRYKDEDVILVQCPFKVSNLSDRCDSQRLVKSKSCKKGCLISIILELIWLTVPLTLKRVRSKFQLFSSIKDRVWIVSLLWVHPRFTSSNWPIWKSSSI